MNFLNQVKLAAGAPLLAKIGPPNAYAKNRAATSGFVGMSI